ncbi:DUF2975 domain-containing protein [Bifidobacterium sp. ESL0769]|uniref:DUF2975 domain-containing protein n=1 Tax=Bifidobacterium sp. ESL0769 TaxID=2983229 RepID=UPI0023F760FE|nr:DUF2975 domain-containing protein [Bifidobacterium sp. ESL0769]WEV68138.1 DUF2975 domain-containing protein [Bifidobacterium sp. ESL0769]
MGSEQPKETPNARTLPQKSGNSKSGHSAHMSHHTLAILLEVTDACVVAACLALTIIVIPAAEKVDELKQGSAVLTAIGMLPLAVVAVCAWKLFSAIGHEETFTSTNVRRIRIIAMAFTISATVWLVELIVSLVAVSNSRRLVILGLGMAFLFCLVLAVVSAALASLTATATELKNENDLVI